MELFNIHHVGARSGTIGFPKVKPLHKSISCTSYDADKECCPQIKKILLAQGYHNVEVIPKGIGKSRRAKFNLNYDPNTSSLFETNEYFNEYYTETSNFDCLLGETHSKVRELTIDLIDLDKINKRNHIDFLSLDTQGSELDILKSAKKSLQETIGIFTEVNFIPLYKEIPLFGDISSYLGELGFQIINLDIHNNVAPRTLPVGFRFKKVISQGDALFFKKPDLIKTDLEKRKLIFAAIVYGQVEFAAFCAKGLEVIDNYPRNSWQYAVNKFISLIIENQTSMPKTFNEIFSKEDSYSRFSETSMPERKIFVKKIKKIKLIVLLVKILRNTYKKFRESQKYIIKKFFNIFLPANKLETFYKEIGKFNFSNSLKEKRVIRLVKNL